MADSKSFVRRNSCGFDLRLLRVFPIIICSDDCSRAVVQFQCRIDQSVGHAEGTERWTKRAKDNPLCFRAGNNKAADEHIVARLHA